MRILLDECIPIAVRKFFGPDHDVRTVEYQKWKTVRNGELLAIAEAVGFEVLVTTDTNMYKDHDLRGRKIGVSVLPSNKLKVLEAHAEQVVKFVLVSREGEYLTCDLERLTARHHLPGSDGPP